MMEIIQPYVAEVVQALLGILVLMVMFLLATFKAKLATWLAGRISTSQRELLQRIGQEAFVHAEVVYKGMGGEAKLQAAYGYASDKLQKLGVTMTPAEIQAGIHKAWLDYQAQVKPESLAESTTSSDMKPF